MSNGILDYSLISEIISVYMQSENSEEEEKEEVRLSYKKELKVYFVELQSHFKKVMSLSKYYELVNCILLILIVLKNLKNEKTLYISLFKRNAKMMDLLETTIEFLKLTDQQEMLKIFVNFYNDQFEFKDLFCNLKLDELYELNCKKIKKLLNFENYSLPKNNEISKKIFQKMLDALLTFNFSYEFLFNNNHIKDTNDKIAIKQMLIHSILRIVFSKEKYNFISYENKYEIKFLENVIRKSVKFYFEKFGENYNVLFRREEVFDDIIKYIFFTYGNNMYFKSFQQPLKLLLDKYLKEETDSNICGYLTQDEFILFYEDFLLKLKMFIPNVVKIALKLIHQTVIDVYKISPDNYAPVLTALIFNFVISPKMQEIYKISPLKNLMVRNLNRLIRNICFNEKFKEDDGLSHYNSIIEVSHLHTKLTIEKILSSFLVDDVDYILKSEFIYDNHKFPSLPNYTFYYDCDYILNVLEYACDKEAFNDFTKEMKYVEKVMSLSKPLNSILTNKKYIERSTFCIKLNFQDLKKLKILDEGLGNEDLKEELVKENELAEENIKNDEYKINIENQPEEIQPNSK
jgi:hypothetical protein